MTDKYILFESIVKYVRPELGDADVNENVRVWPTSGSLYVTLRIDVPIATFSSIDFVIGRFVITTALFISERGNKE